MAQNKFEYFDEQEMTDPMLVPVGTRHMGTDLFNTVNGDIYGEFKKATMVVLADKFNFAAFVDAVASLNIESTDNQPEKVAPQTFAFINGADTAELRKNLAEDLKYVEAYARSGYVGTVAGVNIYTKKDATKGTVVVATRQAVTIFNKKGVEIEQVLWVDKTPQVDETGALVTNNDGEVITPHDYIVKKVAKSLNSVSVAISKVTVSG